MKLIKCDIHNFGSYKDATIDFTTPLCLVSGPTGSGKSTLFDAVTWTLFGVTAKNGRVDDIRRWATEEPTVCSLELELNGSQIKVFRSKGSAHSDNDFFYQESSSPNFLVRGKDLKDTQKLLNSRLGFELTDYLACAYFNEFSETASFFTANSKQRRELLEQIANLTFPTTLTHALTCHKKVLKEQASILSQKIGSQTLYSESLSSYIKQCEADIAKWQDNQTKLIELLKAKSLSYAIDLQAKISLTKKLSDEWEEGFQKKLEITQKNYWVIKDIYDKKKRALDLANERPKKCPHCQSTIKNSALETLQAEVQKYLLKFVQAEKDLEAAKNGQNPYPRQLEIMAQSSNTYGDQLAVAKADKNPHASTLVRLKTELRSVRQELERQELNQTTIQEEITSTEYLIDLVSLLRQKMLLNSVSEIETATNRALQEYFDAEFKVSFSAGDSDNLEVEILKDENLCNYRQLSKGQRGLLKLCFVVSVMKQASARVGIKFSQLFFDESLDGLDTALKQKAFRLYEDLAKTHEGIYVIDHSEELKLLFPDHIRITNSENISSLTYD